MDTKKTSSLSPGYTGAVFFAVFALFFLLFTKYTLLSLNVQPMLPFLPSLLISMLIGALIGKIFGVWLSKTGSWVRPMLIGIFMAFIVLLLISLAAYILTYFRDASLFSRIQHWQDYFVLFGALFLSVLLTIGIWLIPLLALAAIYFNKSFYPRLMALDQTRHPIQKTIKNSDKDHS